MMSAKASQNVQEGHSAPLSGAAGRAMPHSASERTSNVPGASERPIDRFARLLADIRRTHPTTAVMLSAEYIRSVEKERWLAANLPGLEAEWRA
jgi:hypothetical protein